MAGNTTGRKTGRPYGGLGPDERAARRREAFLDAGLELFGTNGYQATTVRALCQQAGVTDRYFYEAFGSAEDLLIAVYRTANARLEDAILEALTDASTRHVDEVIADMLDTFFTAVEDRRVARVLWLEVLGVSPRVDQVYNDNLSAFAELVLSIVRHGYPNWDIDDVQRRILGRALIGAVGQAGAAWMLDNYRVSRATMVAAMSPMFQGLIAVVERAPEST